MSELSEITEEPQRGPWGRAMIHLRNTLLTGLLASIPLIVTIYILQIAYAVINNFSAPWLAKLGMTWEGSGFVVTVLLVYFLGLMTANVIGRRIYESFEQLLARLPIVKTIYSAVKQVMDTLRTFNAGMNFKRVVYVPYPAEGSYILGYVTGVYNRQSDGKEVTNVFIPTSPNPMTGFVILVDSDKVVDCDLTLEQASKIILSAGLLTPTRPMAVVGEAPPFQHTQQETPTS